MPTIVQVNVSQQLAPTPSQLQKTGAFISQGATNTSAGTYTLLTQSSSLAPILAGSTPLSAISTTALIATATTSAPHGLPLGEVISITVSGAVPTGYNGTFNATITGASTFTYQPGSALSAATSPGVYTLEDVAELNAMNLTFFGQGNGQGVYVLELGKGNVNDGVNFLNTWISNNPGIFYAYLVPRTWDSNAAFLSLVAQFEAPSAKTYFFVTTTLATYLNYTGVMKDVLSEIEAPAYAVWPTASLTYLASTGTTATAITSQAHQVVQGEWFQLSGNLPAGYNGYFQALLGTSGQVLVWQLPATVGAETQLGLLLASQYASAGIPASEFSLATAFYNWLNYSPSSSNKITPFAFSFLFGVTSFPTQGNNSLRTQLKAAFTNYVGTGAEGGISDLIQLWGTTEDGNDATYWYSVDWVQINLDLQLANAVINGSNNPQNPLYYNQDGINRLQAVAASVMSSAITNGLAFGTLTMSELAAPAFSAALSANQFAGQVVVNAEPFISYNAENPNDYSIGKYGGISVAYTPSRGFIQIVVQLTVSNFIAP
jgi:hypothetical protein